MRPMQHEILLSGTPGVAGKQHGSWWVKLLTWKAQRVR
jgi:hypothetical protein